MVDIDIAQGQLAVDLDNPDEGACLEKEGKVVARGIVEKSDAQICDIRFASLPPAGPCDLVISCRNGRPPTTVPKKVRHSVTVVDSY